MKIPRAEETVLMFWEVMLMVAVFTVVGNSTRLMLMDGMSRVMSAEVLSEPIAEI
jgi:hypothetical protein